jgi:uncharacterized protein YkwD
VFEQLGFDVGWNQEIRQATLTGAEYVVIITVGSDTFTTNGVPHPLDVPAQIVNDRTMLPIGHVLRSVGFGVDWEGATRTVLITTPQTVAPPASTTENEPHEFELRVLELTNAERAKYGLAPLLWSEALAEAARLHNLDMVTNDFISHTGSDGSSARDRMSAVLPRWRSLAENLAAGPSTPESVVNEWMNSPEHRENMLNGNFTHLGVAYSYSEGTRFHHYWTQNFARLE